MVMNVTRVIIYPVVNGGSDLALGGSIFPIYSLFNGEQFGATNGVSQPSILVMWDFYGDLCREWVIYLD